MFQSTDTTQVTLGELISLCYDEVGGSYPSDDEASLAVAQLLSELLAQYDAELL